jgi:four helix bundle protein
MRRAIVSVPSNIAEGQGRSTHKEFFRFLSVANGSLVELETQIMIACRLGYLSPDTQADLLSQTGDIGRLLHGLRRSLARRIM